MFLSWLQHTLSWLVGKIACCRVVWLKNWLIQRFVAHYHIDMEEVADAKLSAYPHFNAFFTRALKPEARKIDADPDVIVSPVDGLISQVDNVKMGNIIQAKKFYYSLDVLLTPEFPSQGKFTHANFATLYLAPSNYHRVHMPLDGELVAMWHVPGHLFSVNPRSVQKVPKLFARNERIIILFNTRVGQMVVVLVGALLVRSIATVWEGVVETGAYRRIQQWDYGSQKIKLKKGEELGRFQYGSTVILLFENDAIIWEEKLSANQQIFLGQKMGVRIPASE